MTNQTNGNERNAHSEHGNPVRSNETVSTLVEIIGNFINPETTQTIARTLRQILSGFAEVAHQMSPMLQVLLSEQTGRDVQTAISGRRHSNLVR